MGFEKISISKEANQMREITYAEALKEGLCEEMRRDKTVFILGQDVRLVGGFSGVSKEMVKEFGEARIKDTPISETAIVGAAIGSAIAGMRPVADMWFADFMFVAMNEIALTATETRYMSGGQVSVPMVLRSAMGGYIRSGAEHSRSPLATYMHFPGLKIAFPSTPYDAKGLLKASIRDNNPVLFFEHKQLYRDKGPVPEDEYLIPLSLADVKREGTDVSVIATSYMVKKSLEVAEQLQKEGISLEVIDVRSFPLDKKTILKSVKKTGRAVIVDEDFKTGGVGAEIGMVIMEEGFNSLKKPVRRVATEDMILPYGPLEEQILPSSKGITQAIKETVG
jgi:pyruvate/2-oxoglutarate/acetoin dehydrogenase E1 component